MYRTTYPSPLGTITLVADDRHLSALLLPGQQEYSADALSRLVECENSALTAAKHWLDRYFAGEKPTIDMLPLAPQGTLFQQQVWNLLREIPYGQTVSYKTIAARVAALRGMVRMSNRAVGGAVGRNPIAIIIPCHRVIGADGNLTGYGGGLHIKTWLLSHEGVDLSRLHWPNGDML